MNSLGISELGQTMLKLGLYIFAIGIGLRLLAFIGSRLLRGANSEKPLAEKKANPDTKTKPIEASPMSAPAPQPADHLELPKIPVVVVKPPLAGPPAVKPQPPAPNSQPSPPSDFVRLRCSGCIGEWEMGAQASAKYRQSHVIMLPPCPNCGGDRYAVNE